MTDREKPEGERPPRDFWRKVPCGHPLDPMAWIGPDGPVCHCGRLLDPSDSIRFLDSAAIPCAKCGCYVGIPRQSEDDLPPEERNVDRELAERYGYTRRSSQSAGYITVPRALIEEASVACPDGDAKSLLARVLEKAEPVRAPVRAAAEALVSGVVPTGSRWMEISSARLEDLRAALAADREPAREFIPSEYGGTDAELREAAVDAIERAWAYRLGEGGADARFAYRKIAREFVVRGPVADREPEPVQITDEVKRRALAAWLAVPPNAYGEYNNLERMGAALAAVLPAPPLEGEKP